MITKAKQTRAITASFPGEAGLGEGGVVSGRLTARTASGAGKRDQVKAVSPERDDEGEWAGKGETWEHLAEGRHILVKTWDNMEPD